MDANLVHSAGDRAAFYQGVVFKNLQGAKNRLGGFAFSGNLHSAIILLQNRGIYLLMLQSVDAVHHGMINFIDLAVFKLHAQVAIGFRVAGNGKYSGSIFIQPVANLRIGLHFTGKIKDIVWISPVFERSNKWRLIYYYIVGILKKDGFGKIKTWSFHAASYNQSAESELSCLVLGNLKLNTEPLPRVLTTSAFEL